MYLEHFRTWCGTDWPNLRAAAEASADHLGRLSEVVPKFHADNTSIVVFGSLARREMTAGSDMDWSLLIDGPSDPEHFRLAQEFGETVAGLGFPPTGPTETFGSIVLSHELIHHIGGVHDTNQNLTRRLLLLLESRAVGDEVAYQRVLRGILDRYVVRDPRVSRQLKGHFVPRFLLNDVVRFWRTMAVDYAAKQWERAGQGWALRNAKLRMSRKLLFASGLLLCFSFEIHPPSDLDAFDKLPVGQMLIDFFTRQARLTPLEKVAQTLRVRERREAAVKIFGAYDKFVGILNNVNARNHLKQLKSADSEEDELFQQVRSVGHEFQDGLDSLFFEDPELMSLVKRYGVF